MSSCLLGHPAMSFGGGLRFNVNEHLMIRPDIRALPVFAEGETHTLGVFGVQKTHDTWTLRDASGRRLWSGGRW